VPRRRFFHLSQHRVQAAPVVDPAIEQDSRYFGRVANVVEWIFVEKLALAGQVCPITGQFISGFDASGSILCAAPLNCLDADGDGFSPVGSVCGDVDCDDTKTNVFPGATEICDDIDNDCDGSIDEGNICPHHVTLEPEKDNTIFAESGSKSNGAGTKLFVGRTQGSGSTSFRRALIQFPQSEIEQIPSNATPTSARLILNFTRTTDLSGRVVSVHRMTSSWGEAGSIAVPGTGGGEGAGGPADPGDATFTHRFSTRTPGASPAAISPRRQPPAERLSGSPRASRGARARNSIYDSSPNLSSRRARAT